MEGGIVNVPFLKRLLRLYPKCDTLIHINNNLDYLTYYPTPITLFINNKTIAAIPALAGIVIIHA